MHFQEVLVSTAWQRKLQISVLYAIGKNVATFSRCQPDLDLLCTKSSISQTRSAFLTNSCMRFKA